MDANRSNFNVADFLKTLESSKPQSFNANQQGNQLEKVYLNFPDNYGKYQIFPMNSTVTGFPFVSLPNTREVKVHHQSTMADGTVNSYDTWIKLLPAEAYVMWSEGRLVSSLTKDESDLLKTAQALWEQLFEEIGGNQKTPDGRNKATDYLRRRYYTVFNAKCINKWSLSDPRTPERTNFAALFVCTAKGFSTAISDNIEDGKITHGGDITWLNQIYNRELDHRQGYLIFSIALNAGGKIGYTITATHESDRGQYLTNYGITPEEAELMQDPVETFLGWQARKEGDGRLFNRPLIESTIDSMTRELAAVRMAKSTGASIEDAIKSTQETAMMNTQAAPGPVQTTVDPMLQQAHAAAMGGQQIVNPQAVMDNNGTPFVNPPAAQIDPVTQTPVNSNYQQQPTTFAPNFNGNNPFNK